MSNYYTGVEKSQITHNQDTPIFECGVIKKLFWLLYLLSFGHNYASACSPIPCELKTAHNSKISLVTVTQGWKKVKLPTIGRHPFSSVGS